MKKKTTSPDPNSTLGARKTLTLNETDPGAARRSIARLLVSPQFAAARAIQATEGDKGYGAQLDTPALVRCLREQAAAVHAGDLAQVEAMLMNQATTLQSLFVWLTERGMVQITIPAFEVNLRLALRAQAQCTRTLEVLATIKNPPVVIAKQANIAQQQQVNNNVAPLVRETENSQNKLLETLPGERLESGTAATASGADSDLATVGAVNRSEVGSR